MGISPIRPELTPTPETLAPRKPGDRTTLSASFTASLEAVDRSLREGDQAISALAAGRAEHIHQAMIALEKASVNLELLLQIRNKIVAAYDEISRMQL